MPDRDWPPAPRLAARVLRSSSYLLAALAGAGVLAFRPAIAYDGASVAWVAALAWVAILAGAVSFVGAAAHRWRVEWVALWPAGAALAGYSVLGWIRVGQGSVTALAEAAALGSLAALIFARGIDLLVFSMELRAVRRRRVAAHARVVRGGR